MTSQAPVEARPETDGGRVVALDGLRGLAAVVVLLHHALLVAPTFAASHRSGPLPARPAWIDSPLHVVVAGTEAVFVFFVLSGFVLARTYVRGTRFGLGYYPRRFLRLYVPVVGAALLAAALRAASHQPLGDGSWWVDRHAAAPTLGTTLAAVTLLVGPFNEINSVLWSLEYEVLFSILLPVYLLGARVAGRGRPALAVACVVVSGVAAGGALPGDLYAGYMPMFGLGVLLAFAEPRLREVLGRLRGGGWAVALVGVTVVLLTAPWSLRTFVPASEEPGSALLVTGRAATVVGAGLAVALAAAWPSAQAALGGPVLRWAGSRSYSLYLVHVPVIVLIATGLDVTRPTVATFLGSIVASLLLAEAFHRVVERPGLALARSWGDRDGVRAGSARGLPSG